VTRLVDSTVKGDPPDKAFPPDAIASREASDTGQAWREFAAAHGAPRGDRQTNGPAARADARAARDGDVLVDLSFLSLIRVHGPDAQSFLQGQLTNDIRSVGPERSQISAWCTPKGRMLAIFRIFMRDDGYILQLPGSLQPEILRRMRMFVLRSKLVLEDASEALVRIGISGPNVARYIDQAGCRVPDAVDAVVRDGPFSIVALPGPHPRFELIGPPEAARELWLKLVRVARPISPEAWAWLNIQAGLPEVLPGTVEALVPQMANLDLLEGVSFGKGCYPGQEIVARVKYLGRIKQRMFPARTGTPVCPSPGTTIVPSSGDGQPAGWIVDAQAAPDGGCDMLAVLTLEQRQNDLRLGESGGPQIEVSHSPYPVDNAG
jgi:folate-binding protein YgfZ